MADYCAFIRTNYFRVTDEEKYAKLFDRLTSDCGVLDCTKQENGITYHGFGSYSYVDYCYKSKDCDPDDDFDYEYDFDKFLSELQTILPDDEAFIYQEVGHEKLRYVSGAALIVPNKIIESVSLSDLALAKAKELLGESFTTQLDY